MQHSIKHDADADASLYPIFYTCSADAELSESKERRIEDNLGTGYNIKISKETRIE